MQGSSGVNQGSNCLEMSYGHQIWWEESLTKALCIAWGQRSCRDQLGSIRGQFAKQYPMATRFGGENPNQSVMHRLGQRSCRAQLGSTRGQFPGGYSTLNWVRMCGPKFRTPPYNKTREDANLLPISKPFVSLRALFKTNQCFLQCKLGCISTFWRPVDKPKDKFIGNYAFWKNATYIKTNFQIKKGP